MAKRDSKWKRNVISIFIVLLMVFSVLGIMLSRDEGEQTKKYNGHKFVARENKWLLSIDKKWIDFDYFPTAVEDIEVNDEIKDRILSTEMLHITFDPDNVTESMDKMRFDLTNLLANLHDIYAASSVIKNSTEYNLPIMTCENATVFVPIIELKLGDETAIGMEDNCIIIRAESAEDMIRLRDAMIYNILGVME